MSTRWVPIESNPEVFNEVLKDIHCDTQKFYFTDIYGTDDESLSFIDGQVIAIVFLYPYVEKIIETLKSQADPKDPNVWFMKQKISNSCASVGDHFCSCFHRLVSLKQDNQNRRDDDLGPLVLSVKNDFATSDPRSLKRCQLMTVSSLRKKGHVELLHAVINSVDTHAISEGWLKNFLEQCKEKDAEGKGDQFAQDEVYKAIHHKHALKGQTDAPLPEDAALYHFCSYVCVQDKLYMLDGRNEYPLLQGSTTQGSFLKDAISAILPILSLLEDNPNYSLIALCKKE